jgi:hypothetical protein
MARPRLQTAFGSAENYARPKRPLTAQATFPLLAFPVRLMPVNVVARPEEENGDMHMSNPDPISRGASRHTADVTARIRLATLAPRNGC